MGISIVSKWAARKEVKYGTLKMINIKEEKMLRNFSLITQKNAVLSHAVDEFLSYIKTYSYDKLLSDGRL